MGRMERKNCVQWAMPEQLLAPLGGGKFGFAHPPPSLSLLVMVEVLCVMTVQLKVPVPSVFPSLTKVSAILDEHMCETTVTFGISSGMMGTCLNQPWLI